MVLKNIFEYYRDPLDSRTYVLYNIIMTNISSGEDIMQKLEILSAAAKYDVACTSSGVSRKVEKGKLGNAVASGICHTFSSDGRCVSLLKILMTNHCIFDCKYCVNRCSNDIRRAFFTPKEICDLTVEFYKRNYIEGLFLSSGIINSPHYTMEKICETLSLLRNEYKFNGYIHVKAIPGVSDDLLAQAGFLADRMSVNIEFPSEASLRKFAPNKNFKLISDPMQKIKDSIVSHRLSIGENIKLPRSNINNYIPGSIFYDQKKLEGSSSAPVLTLPKSLTKNRPFVPSGQSTQMIIGAGDESDYNILMSTQNLYKNFDLKRVFYSAYIPVNEDTCLPSLDEPVPLLREHRLYQADWLLRFYGFHAEELLSTNEPNFNPYMDPKCNWAVKHLEYFPVEIQTADISLLLRVPGIGPKAAKRIVTSRRYSLLDHNSLAKMGVVLKRAHYFITCNGKMMYKTLIDEKYISDRLISLNNKENWQHSYSPERQLSLFEDFGVS